jgi:hypothetical protein
MWIFKEKIKRLIELIQILGEIIQSEVLFVAKEGVAILANDPKK